MIDIETTMLAALNDILSEEVFHVAVNRVEDHTADELRAMVIRIYDIAQGAVAEAGAAS